MERFVMILVVTLLVLRLTSLAQGDLLITQKRVVFEENKQREALDLVNIGKDTAIYSISFIQYNQKENGGYVTVEKSDSGQMFAEPYLRIFPREVVLAPGEPQIVMLQCRRMLNMKPGEYRSHLYFRSEKDYRPLRDNSADTIKAISVKLIPIYGITIPVIIRSGEMKINSSLSNLKLVNQHDSIFALKLEINREGNCSTYGDLIVDYFPAKGKPYEIGKVKGVKVFTNLNKLNMAINLKTTPGMDLRYGKLKVHYTNPDSKDIVYAEAELPLTEQPSIAQGVTGDQNNGQGNKQNGDKNNERRREQ